MATIKVTVSDDGSGTLKASAVAENTRFVNRYAAEIDYTAAGGLNVAKTLTGRDMAEGQFTIKVTPDNEASAYALGLSLEGAEIAMPAAADGVQAVKSALGEQHVVLRQSDVGKTYTYKVVEVVGEKVNGYTYDTTEYTVTVMAWDDPQKAALTGSPPRWPGLRASRRTCTAQTRLLPAQAPQWFPSPTRMPPPPITRAAPPLR